MGQPIRDRLIVRAEMSADENGVGNVYINGPICQWALPDIFNETDASTLRRALSSVADAKTLNVYIDSPGGYLDEGMTMMREIAEHKATTKHAFLMKCASAATLPALACDRVSIYEGGEYMIHNPRACIEGTPKEIINYGEGLLKRAGSIAKMYCKKAKRKSEAEVQQMMDDETWMTPDDAVEMGFADDIIPIVPTSGGVMMCADRDIGYYERMAQLFGYHHMPERLMCAKGKAKTSSLFDTGIDAPNSGALSNNNQNGKEGRKIMTYEELKKEAPELFERVYSEGVMAERSRMQALDEMRDDDDDEFAKACAQIIDDAKYGENPETAEKAAMRILNMRRENKKKMQGNRSGYMEKRREETMQMKGVRGGASTDNDAAQSDADEIKAFAEMMKGYAR